MEQTLKSDKKNKLDYPLEIYRKHDYKGVQKKEFKKKDIIVERPIKIVEFKDGQKIERIEYEKINLTKKTNETAKVLKNNNAEQTLAKLEEIFKVNK